MRALLAGLMIVLAIGFTGCSGSSDDGGGDSAPAAEDTSEGSGN